MNGKQPPSCSQFTVLKVSFNLPVGSYLSPGTPGVKQHYSSAFSQLSAPLLLQITQEVKTIVCGFLTQRSTPPPHARGPSLEESGQ